MSLVHIANSAITKDQQSDTLHFMSPSFITFGGSKTVGEAEIFPANVYINATSNNLYYIRRKEFTDVHSDLKDFQANGRR